VILIHLTALTGLILFPWPGLSVLLGAFALAYLGGLGTTIAYHRTIAHRSLRLNPAVRLVLTFFAMLNGSGAPVSWAAYHRHHHANADTDQDISSPRIGGFWWSHLRWLWQAGPAPEAHYCRDLEGFSYRMWGPAQIPILALSFFGGLAFGWAGFFWLGAIRLVYSLHAQCFVNSIAHMRPDAKPGEDSSQNIWWLGFLQFLQGENWHSNHHARPSSARLGWTFWQIDFGWYAIVAMEKLGLATKVRRNS
jgi:stearoyl-CoA desaturase (delta-9 desaturase)